MGAIRTRSEVRSFLDSLVGQSVNSKTAPYQGQCVSLIKALLEYLGVDNPYKARGNAKDVGDTYLREGIATNGDGWLRIVVNRSMGYIGGVYYGHVWIDLANEANYEQNGARALHTTKNTRPYSRRQQVVNLDKWIKAEVAKKSNDQIADEVIAGAWGNGEDRKNRLTKAGYDYSAVQDIVNKKVGTSGAVYHTVAKGENLTVIANRYGTTWQNIAKLNNLANANLIYPNQKLRIR